MWVGPGGGVDICGGQIVLVPDIISLERCIGATEEAHEWEASLLDRKSLIAFAVSDLLVSVIP